MTSIVNGRYVVGEKIGSGNFCDVHKAMDLQNDRRPVAIRVLNKTHSFLPGSRSSFITENELLLQLDDPRIVKVHDFVPEVEWCDAETGVRSTPMMVQELGTFGDLFDTIKRGGGLEYPIAKFIFRELLDAVGFLHNRRVVHNDIKLDQIIINGKGQVKLLDFGLAQSFSPDQAIQSVRSIGTPGFIPPEAFQPDVRDPRKADVFACGVVLFTILVGFPPFTTCRTGDPYFNLWRNNKSAYWAHIHKHAKAPLSADAMFMLELLMEPTPELRVDVESAREHPFLNGAMATSADLLAWLEQIGGKVTR